MWRRGVCTTARRCGNQLLFEPHVEPLTEKGKKVIRKADITNAPIQHPRSGSEIDQLLNTLVVLHPTAAKEQREALHNHFAALVRAESVPQCDVTGVDMHTYPLELHSTPLAPESSVRRSASKSTPFGLHIRPPRRLRSTTLGLVASSQTSSSRMHFVRTVHSTVLSTGELEDSSLIRHNLVECAPPSGSLLDDPGFIIPDEPLLRNPTTEMNSDHSTSQDQERSLLSMDRELWQYYESRRPTKQVLAARAATIRSIRSAVNKFAQKQGTGRVKGVKYEVLPFGSSLTGADEVDSDLDLVLIDPLYPNGWRPDVKHHKMPTCMYDVRKLARSLWKFGFTDILPIPKARVPIISGKSPTDPPIHFDLNINRRNGLFNSGLIAAYAEVHPHVRPLLVILKAWSRAVGLDAPAVTIKMGRRTFGSVRPFSSYIMGTLLVAYMQHIRMLPNLQEPFVCPITDALEPAVLAKSEYKMQRRPGPQAATMDHVWWDIGSEGPDIRIPYDTRFLDANSEQVQQWQKTRQREGVPEPTLAETLHGFFTFYGRQFNYGFEAVSVRDGGIVPRRSMPGYRAPERFFNELHYDLIRGTHLSESQANSLPTPEPLREGDSLEIDLEIEREAATLLDMPTDLEQFRAATLVIVDPIFRQNNIGRVALRQHVATFVSECARAESVFELNLGFTALLTRKFKAGKGKKGKK